MIDPKYNKLRYEKSVSRIWNSAWSIVWDITYNEDDRRNVWKKCMDGMYDFVSDRVDFVLDRVDFVGIRIKI